MTEAADLLHDRLRGPDRGWSAGEDVGDRGIDGQVERILALDDLMDEPDALCAEIVPP